MRRVVPLVAVLALVACGKAGESQTVKVSLLPRLVLQPEDVRGLEAFDVGRITQFDAPSGPRADPTRFGRLDGWKADYKVGGGTATRGPLVVHSQADLFSDSDGALKDLAIYRQQFQHSADASPGSAQIFDPEIGDASAGFALRQGGTPALRVFTVAWTEGSVSASVTVNGFTGVSQAEVSRLARRQERRIVQASS